MWSVVIQEDPLWDDRFQHHRRHQRPSLSSLPSLASDPVLFKTCLVKATYSLNELLTCSASSGTCATIHSTASWVQAVRDAGACGEVALADYVGRQFAIKTTLSSAVRGHEDSLFVELEPLDRMTLSSQPVLLKSQRRRTAHHYYYQQQQEQHQQQHFNKKKNNNNRASTTNSSSLTPYILERSDVTCRNQQLEMMGRILLWCPEKYWEQNGQVDKIQQHEQAISKQVAMLLWGWTQAYLVNDDAIVRHVATAVVQDTLRQYLQQSSSLSSSSSSSGKSLQGVAFVANGSILPRKSGATQAPMASPPAVPFMAPADSPMTQTIQLSIPSSLLDFVPPHLVVTTTTTSSMSTIAVTGLLIPPGVSLIVGGGYHGKSTLLRTLAAGVYNKIPGDGREFCVTTAKALTIRAEDGRYVNNCNVSAFISNLPPLRTTTLTSTSSTSTSTSTAATSINTLHLPRDEEGSLSPSSPPSSPAATMDTRHFSTGEASGSTSQAANVMEALELDTTCFLVDEDVSAANFMARDGRMRALVMDESISPLLYRVNGLFHTKGVSSIVVVGGVGDWLDVPHNVILMQKYQCLDATAKARSISKQFSHGHVQYGGRGVVHRLEWNDVEHSPIPRRPTTESARALDKNCTLLGLLDGGTGLVFHRTVPSSSSSTNTNNKSNSTNTNNNNNNKSDNQDDDLISDEGDEEEFNRYVDMSRCEQLLGKKPQLFGCGLAVLWVLEASRRHVELGLSALLDKLDDELNAKGLLSVLAPNDMLQQELIQTLGHIYRPRRLEVGQAICRLRGICFEELPDKELEEARAKAIAEEERKKTELMNLWNSRRHNKRVDEA